MSEHCAPMPVLSKHVVWDAPPFLLSRKGSVRVSAYLFKFIARQRFVPSLVQVGSCHGVGSRSSMRWRGCGGDLGRGICAMVCERCAFSAPGAASGLCAEDMSERVAVAAVHDMFMLWQSHTCPCVRRRPSRVWSVL